VPSQSGWFNHIGAISDARILADIARRLRGEPPFSHLPGSPLPEIEKANLATDGAQMATDKKE
jgi:hypothetical protein